MLDQRLSTVPQHQWISKLFGFNFTVEYRPGRLNIVANALSRRAQPEMELAVLSSPSFQLFTDLRDELQTNSALRDNITTTRGSDWTVQDGLIRRGSRVFIPHSSVHLDTILHMAHSVGHEGAQKTLNRLRWDFIIDNDRTVVRDFVKACVVYQRNKTETLQPVGLLQPLEIPQ